LTATDGVAGDGYGSAVDISNDVLVAGAPGVDDMGADAGALYVARYSNENWTQEAKLTAADGVAGDGYGSAVGISNDTAVVGAPGLDDMGADAGAAYVVRYYNENWTQEAKLTANDGMAGDDFGRSVAIDGDYAVVGAPGANSATGVAYLYYRNVTTGWELQTQLAALNGMAGDDFGRTVAISGRRVIVGAPGADDNGIDSGAAYVFERTGSSWVEQVRVTAADGAAGDGFATSVGISGDRFLVGAPGDGDNGIDSGSAYFFAYTGPSPYAIPGDVYLSEAGDNKASESENTGFAELYNCCDASVNVGGYLLRRGTNSGTFAPDGNNYTIPEGTTIDGLSHLIIGNGADETSFKSAWGITDDINYLPGNSGLDIANGHAYQLYNPSTRSEEIDSSPEVPVTQHVVQETVGSWNPPESTDNTTPGEDSQGQTLPVTLSSFSAVQTSANFAQINWVTQSETGLVGYFIYRNISQDFSNGIKINPTTITANNSSSGGNYTFTDENVELEQTYFYWLESVEYNGNTEFFGPVTLTIIQEEEPTPEFPKITALHNAYPNPFNPETTISFSVKKLETATLEIFNMKGQRVKSYPAFTAGNHNIIWNGTNNNGNSVGSGLFFYRLKSDSVQQVRKMLMLK
ncbi:MAG: T9SS type A sorting domain-containing protein, partial [Candidatus Cloacimonetes bacterium]|nr:T9SS type A sorting domain-containing protein [Candidatus Cloacimonadota bacterium]